jgi:DNA-binding protein HU-beta
MTEPFVPQGLKNQAEIAILPYVLYNCVVPTKNTRLRGETTMNKTELIAAMAETSGLSKKDCDAALAAFITTVETALKSGEKVQLIGFGSFEVKERAARTGRNPRTKETVEIPASKAPVFKAGQAFKDAIR